MITRKVFDNKRLHERMWDGKIVNNSLNSFWHSKTKIMPDLIQLCIASVVSGDININIWILGDTPYEFDGVYKGIIENASGNVRFINYSSIFDKEFSNDEIWNSRTPDGQKVYNSAFVDYCRWYIAHKFPFALIWDLDILVTNPNALKDIIFSDDLNPLIVVEDSFHKYNKLGTVHPINGIFRNDESSIAHNILKKCEKTLQAYKDEVIPHGMLGPRLIYDELLNDPTYSKEMLLYSLQGHSNLLNIIPHEAFFEIGYDEIELFRNSTTPSTIRRITRNGVVGIHLWMSILRQRGITNDLLQHNTFIKLISDCLIKHHEISPIKIRKYYAKK